MARARDQPGDLRVSQRRRASTARCSSASTRTRCREPAFASALEVLAANGVDVMIADGDEYTPTPAVSHAILVYNRGRTTGLADGIVITPSHNPPDRRRLQIQPAARRARRHGRHRLDRSRGERAARRTRPEGVRRMPLAKARRARRRRIVTTISTPTSSDLGNVIDMEAIRGARRRAWAWIRSAAPACTTGRAIAERYGLDLTRRQRRGRSDLPLHDRSTGTARSAWIPPRRTPCSA